jgi:hypothetical protein
LVTGGAFSRQGDGTAGTEAEALGRSSWEDAPQARGVTNEDEVGGEGEAY